MNKYLNSAQEQWLIKQKKSFLWRSQWPTWMLIAIIYSGWYFTLAYWQVMGVYLSSFLLVLLNSWYMSLQHELLHGHPTRKSQVNRLFGLLPLAVWYPYDLYKQQHMIHHTDEQLTDPILDPESNYIFLDKWNKASGLRKVFFRLSRTVLGHLSVGPIISIIAIVKHLYLSFKKSNHLAIYMWLEHIILLAMLFTVLHKVFHFSIIAYLLIAYFSLSLALMRSFYEHRPAEKSEDRSVINEPGLFFRVLFLDNNYHLVHHDLPHVPWFMLKKVFTQHRTQYINRNHHFYYQGYSQMFKEHHSSLIDSPIHQRSFKRVNDRIKLHIRHAD